MKIKITKGGIFGADGEIAVGTTLTVKEEPTGWAGRYEIISGSTEGKTAVTAAAGTEAKTAEQVLELKDGNFMSFKSEAKKLLGGDTPGTKEEIIAALEDLATKP
ncbi:hypothetical protein OSJ77_19985 [Phyllobacterium sp. 0TCS1.6C]|uniref:hypothetical protein n=1 Tax=unclassified Phyllobacterium TaxID=2638441 RepID=UPI00226518F4|nr:MULTISPECIES: hypothetical protein [unclassified Phyllobacterium]MCX8282475.1 hypothetical protein [Phyllobacterium sp. 0TCS1.6C]MCX8292567.1 hypothetical protein [Phyllobacterium sp. 0TCS1.6A]